ncbi:hypothetical protein [Nonomuraea rubra]
MRAEAKAGDEPGPEGTAEAGDEGVPEAADRGEAQDLGRQGG